MHATLARWLPPDVGPETITASIGLISDTHMPDRLTELPAPIFDILHGVDLLLHAGDVGELHVLDRLGVIAPVVAVHGNDETAEAQRELPYQQLLAIAGQRIVLTHAHYPDRAEELASRRDDTWRPKLERRMAFGRRAGAPIVVFGHTHVPMACQMDNVLLVNPGAVASGSHTWRQKRRTVALLYMRADRLPLVVHIDLASPDRPFVPRIDWDAGFAAALGQFNESILAPDLEPDHQRLYAIAQQALEPSIGAIRRVAMRCWSGEQPYITRAELLAELEAAPGLPARVWAEFEALLCDKMTR
jgi:putative phosphoesterase